MKKIILLVLLIFLSTKIHSQTSTLIINNYSNLILEGMVYANPISGSSCYPAITSGNGSAWSIIVQPGTPTNPYTVTYDKYRFASLPATNFPLTQWWTQTASTSPAQYRSVGHPLFYANGPIDLSTNWTGFYFVTKNTNGIYHAEQPIGDPTYFNMGCTPCVYSYNAISGDTEAEWFTLSSGGTNYTYVQVYNY